MIIYEYLEPIDDHPFDWISALFWAQKWSGHLSEASPLVDPMGASQTYSYRCCHTVGASNPLDLPPTQDSSGFSGIPY